MRDFVRGRLSPLFPLNALRPLIGLSKRPPRRFPGRTDLTVRARPIRHQYFHSSVLTEQPRAQSLPSLPPFCISGLGLLSLGHTQLSTPRPPGLHRSHQVSLPPKRSPLRTFGIRRGSAYAVTTLSGHPTDPFWGQEDDSLLTWQLFVRHYMTIPHRRPSLLVRCHLDAEI